MRVVHILLRSSVKRHRLAILGSSLAFFLAFPAHAIDTSEEEAQCLDIGFKRKTTAFANCVLELVDRRGSSVSQTQDPDDVTCRKYGFKPKTDNYAACRQQIDQARQQAQQQQAAYAQQKAEYDALVAEQKREKDRQRGLALLQIAAGLSSGRSNPMLPSAPTPPQNYNRTYILPGGKMMNCNTVGSTTTCF